MTVADFQYFANYQRNIAKFIFTEGSNLSKKDYIKLNDEIRDIDTFLKSNEKFLK